MLIWIILFFIVIIISFIMAVKSMSDYQEKPLSLGLNYSLFLITNPLQLTSEILEKIYEEALKSNTPFSLEKLFKGGCTTYSPERMMELV